MAFDVREEYMKRLRERQNTAPDRESSINSSNSRFDVRQAYAKISNATSVNNGETHPWEKSSKKDKKNTDSTFDFSAIAQNPDFEEKSVYDSAAGRYEPDYGKGLGAALKRYGNTSNGYENNGSLQYHTINGDQNAYYTLYNLSGYDTTAEKLKGLTDDEKKVYNYLYNTGDTAHAAEYLTYLDNELNARETQKSGDRIAQYAVEHPVATSVAAVIASPDAKINSYIRQALDYADDGEIDENAGYNLISNNINASQSSISDAIEKSGKWGKVGSFSYNIGMSMANFLLTSAITGGMEPLALAVMGTEAASDTVVNAKRNGQDDTRAFVLGTIAGLAEVATEKIGYDALFKADMKTTILKYISRNMLSEGAEEATSDVINWSAQLLYDAIDGKRESDILQMYDSAKSNGRTDKQALLDTIMECLKDAGLDALGGAVSGGIMAGVGSAGLYRNTGKAINDTMSADEKSGFIDMVANEGGKKAKALAQSVKESGGSVGNRELGRLYTTNYDEQRKNLSDMAKTFKTKNAQTAFTENYDPTKSLSEYYRQATKLYNHALKGDNINLSDYGDLSVDQSISIIEAARKDARKGVTANEQQRGENTVSDIPSGDNVQGSGVTSESMAGEAERFDTGTGGSAEANIQTVQGEVKAGQQLTTRSLGFSDGSDVVMTVAQESEATQAAQAVANDAGCVLIPVTSDITFENGAKPARAAVIGNKIIVNMNAAGGNSELAARFTRHEVYHRRILQNNIDSAEVLKSAVRSGKVTIDEMNRFTELYRELYPNLSDDELFDEMVCDAYAGIDDVPTAAEQVGMGDLAKSARETAKSVGEVANESAARYDNAWENTRNTLAENASENNADQAGSYSRAPSISTLQRRNQILKDQVKELTKQLKEESNLSSRKAQRIVSEGTIRRHFDIIFDGFDVKTKTKEAMLPQIKAVADEMQSLKKQFSKGEINEEDMQTSLLALKDRFADVSRSAANDALYSEEYEKSLKKAVMDAKDNLSVEDAESIEQMAKYVTDDAFSVSKAAISQEIGNRLYELAMAEAFNTQTAADMAYIAGQIEQGKHDAKQIRTLSDELTKQKAYYQNMVKDLRKQKNDRIQSITDYYREKVDSIKADHKLADEQERLFKIVRRLNNKKLPPATRAQLDNMIGDIDTVAISLGVKKRNDILELSEWYNRITDPNSPEYSPDFVENAAVQKEIDRLSKRSVRDMDAEEVESLTKTLLFFEKLVQTRDAFIKSELVMNARFAASQSAVDVGAAHPAKVQNWFVKGTTAILDKSLSFKRLMHSVTGFNDSSPIYKLAEELNDGQRQLFKYQMDGYNQIREYVNDKAFMKEMRERRYNLGELLSRDLGETVEINGEMLCSLYMHSLNDDNMRHIMNGGVVIPNLDLLLKGKVEDAYNFSSTITMTRSEIQRICKKAMSQRQREYCEKAKSMLADNKKTLNATSLELYGYEIATVDNYFRISVDRDTLSFNETEKAQDPRISSLGMLKERTRAFNPIYLDGMTSVLSRTIDDTAKFCGLSIPLRNFNMAMGTLIPDGMGNTRTTLRAVIKKRCGSVSTDVIQNFISDLQGGNRKGQHPFISKLLNNYTKATFTLNAPLSLKQTASYPTIAPIVGWDSMTEALTSKREVSDRLIAKYTPLMWKRTLGYTDAEIISVTAGKKQIPKALNWIPGADHMTVKTVWKACEINIEKNRTFDKGSDAYYKAVADLFNRCVEETQPSYTVLQRPEFLRNDDILKHMFFLYKTVPMQNFGLLYDAGGAYAAAQRALNNCQPKDVYKYRQLVNAKRKELTSVIVSQIVSLAQYTAIGAAWNFLRRKDRDWKDVLTDFGISFLENTFSVIPVGMLVGSVAESLVNVVSLIVSGKKVFTVNQFGTDISYLGNVLDIVYDIQRMVQNGSDGDWEKAGKSGMRFAEEVATTFGLPLRNIDNVFKAALEWAKEIS